MSRLQNAIFGKGATRGEILFSVGCGLAGSALAAYCAWDAALHLVWWQWILLMILAFDIIGGIPANSTNAAVGQHHKGDRPFAPLIFTLGHIHPFLVWLLMPGFDLAAATALWATAGASVLLVLLSSAPLKRPLALVCVAAGICAQQLWFPAAGWEWFAPAFLLKLVAGHAVPATVYGTAANSAEATSCKKGETA